MANQQPESSPLNELSEDMIDLQMRLSFQEQTIEALDQTILLQQQQIEKLNKEMQRVKRKMEQHQQQGQETPFDPANERPPHW